MSMVRAAVAALLIGSTVTADAATFVVTNTNSSGAGSLAKAIEDANLTADADVINFAILSFSAVKTIGGTLPEITQPLTIDGYTQSGASKNTIEEGATNAVLKIQLDASAVGVGGVMLKINAPTTLRGLAIFNLPVKATAIDVLEDASADIRGCFIGTNAFAAVASGGGNGVSVRGSATLGGSSEGDRNLISGNAASGVLVRGFGVSLLNNLIGTDADGEPVLGNGTGLLYTSSVGISSIGGSSPETGNVFAGNSVSGIRIGQASVGSVSIGANRFFDNGGLGIDLLGNGVTANDAGDADDGPNGLQNFPVLTFARTSAATIVVEGSLESEPGTYRVNFYRSSEVDPSGFGEGELFVDTIEVVVPDGETEAFFSAQLAAGEGLDSTPFLTATAESLNTSGSSEFSEAIEMVDGGQELVVTSAANSGVGSLRSAIIAANQDADINTIVFDIAGDGPHTVPLLNVLEVLTPVIIDGYSQPGSAVNTLEAGSNADLRIVLDASGFLGNDPAAIALSTPASNSLIRGLVVHGAPKRGISMFAAEQVRVEGCFIGTDVTGMVDLGNAGDGINTGSGGGMVIGGPLPSQRNIVSGNDEFGISSGGEGTVIINNIVGGDALGTGNIGNGRDGIIVDGAGAIIGGDEEGEGNLIRGNDQAGIAVNSGSGHRVHGNTILDNGELGIDVDSGPSGTRGVTGNDADDDDAGANGSQNFPEFFTELEPGSFAVRGTLDVPAAANEAAYTIRVFANTECDPSDHGEGELFLGAREVLLSGNDEKFSFTLPLDVPAGLLFTATATEEATGNTSEFSECFDPDFEPVFCGDASQDGEVSAADGLRTLRAAVGTEQCALCRCDVNKSGGISTTDALLVLRVGVGQQVALDCIQCD